MKRLISVMVVGLLVLSFCETALAQEEYELIYKFTEGEKWTERFKIKGVQEEGGMKVTTEMEGEVAYEIEKVDEKGTASITGTLKKLKIEMDMPVVGKIEFDSEKKEGDEGDNPVAEQVAEQFRQMMKQKIQMKVMKNGKVERRGADSPGGLETFLSLPEGKVKIGHKWEHTIKLEGAKGKEDVKVESRFTKKEEKECAVIVTRDNWEDEKECKINFTTYFDIKSGRILKMKGKVGPIVEFESEIASEK